jgi:Tfp pilus assembly protein PilN
MLWLTIGLGVLVALVAIAYVARPLFQTQRSLQSTDDDALGELMARKDAVLLNIKEVEFDHRTGKLNDEDFQRYNLRLRQQAVALLKQIEKLAPDIQDLDSELEAAIAAERTVKSVQTAPETLSSPAAASAVAPRFCHQCGEAIGLGDNFCAACGTKVRSAVPA